MFKSTLIAILFFVPVFAYAETIIYTSDQANTANSMTIEDDGFKFVINDGTNTTGENYLYDNQIPASAGDYKVWWSANLTNCAVWADHSFFKLTWDGGIPLYPALGRTTGADIVVTASTTIVDITSTGAGEHISFWNFGCDDNGWITIHKLEHEGTVIFDYLPQEEATSTPTSTPSVLLPPMQTISLLSTTSCTGTSTSSVCTYEYSTTSATSTEAQYLGYILQHLKNAFIYAVWLTTFLLVLGVLLLFMRTRYGHY